MDSIALPTELPFEIQADGSLVLHLRDHCVETTAKAAHRALVTALLEERLPEGVDPRVVDLLEALLRTTDFPALRAAHPEVNAGANTDVRLWRDGQGALCWAVVASR